MLYFVSLVSFSSDLGRFCEQRRIFFYQDRIAKPDSRHFAALSGQTREETFRRRSAGSFRKQQLVIEPKNGPLQKEKEKI